jgi:peptidoglycan/LPS O-acetylase OafA/YrhL
MSFPTGILNGGASDEEKFDPDPKLRFNSLLSIRTYIWALRRLWSFIWPKAYRAPNEKLRPTAYLDGLRGFAAFLVYWHHHQLWAHGNTFLNHAFENAYGYEDMHFMASLPIVRTFFTGGHFAVATFFVTSGYVLSLKPLMLIQAGDLNALLPNLSSALFRRWIRLFLPIIIVITVYQTSWYVFGCIVRGIEQQENWLKQLWEGYLEFKHFSFIFREGGKPWLSFHFHLWSIPVEFKGSIVIYTALTAFACCVKNVRLLGSLGLVFYFMYIVDGWYGAMFMAGLLICDLDLLAQKDELPRWMKKLEPFKLIIFYHLFLFSLILGGVPAETQDIANLAKQPGWYYLSFLKPQAPYDYKWFYLFWAAIFLVSSVPRIRWLKAFFETRFCQWLGHISYSLYMMHGPVIWLLGDRMYAATGWYVEDHEEKMPNWANAWPLPKTGPMGLELSFLAPQIVLLPLTLWLADVVTRGVDTPSVKFASWLYKKTLPSAQQQQPNKEQLRPN